MSALGLMAPPPIGRIREGDRREDPECRVCGCTEDEACVVAGVPCSWIPDPRGLGPLCSACEADA